MNNNDFLNCVKESFFKYLDTGSRSNEKLKILHGAIARDLSNRLGTEYKIHSLGFGDNKEKGMIGRYMEKKVDIGIEKNKDVIGAIALKFIMRNYSQNSNNYFENMLGETANIRAAGKPYFQIVVLPSKIPYFNDKGIITHIEKISEHNLEKYINLSNDNISDFLHTPNKTLIYLIDLPKLPATINTREEYIEFYKKNNKFDVITDTEEYNFGSAVVFNDYNTFIDKVVHTILAI